WNGSKTPHRRFRSRTTRGKKSPKSIPFIAPRSRRKKFFLKIRFVKHRMQGSLTKWNRWKSSSLPKSAACGKTARKKKKSCALALPNNEGGLLDPRILAELM